MKHIKLVIGPMIAAAIMACGPASAQTLKEKCEALATAAAAPDITQATFVAAGQLNFPGPPPVSISAPDHCLIQGALAPHVGIDGKNYAIGYELRLPANWNGKFMFQGGGGSDGVLRPAIGIQATGEISGAGQGLCDRFHRCRPSRRARHHRPLSVRPRSAGPRRQGLQPYSGGHRQGEAIDRSGLWPAADARLFRRLLQWRPPGHGRDPALSATVRRRGRGRAGLPGAARGHRGDGRGADVRLDCSQGRRWQARSRLGAEHGRPETAVGEDHGACDAADGIADGMVNNVKACKFDRAGAGLRGRTDRAPASRRTRPRRSIACSKVRAWPMATCCIRTGPTIPALPAPAGPRGRSARPPRCRRTPAM